MSPHPLPFLLRRRSASHSCAAQGARSRGYTLIELVVTLIVIGILASIATVTYNTQHDNVAGTEPKRTLSSVATAQKLQYRTRGSFATNPTTLAKLEPSVGYTTSGAEPSTSRTLVSVASSEASMGQGVLIGAVRYDALGLAVLSQTDECWAIVTFPDSADPAVLPDNTFRYKPTAARPCSAQQAVASYVSTGVEQW